MTRRARKLIPILLAGASVLTIAGAASVAGGFFNFSNFNFRTTVPTTQSRTFLETHVYTGGPKLSLKSDGLLKWNRHNLLPTAKGSVTGWPTSGGATPTVTTAVLGPDGDTGMLLITPAISTATHFTYPAAPTVPLGRTYTDSIYLSPAQSNFALFGGHDGGNYFVASFELTGAGSVRATSTNTTASITLVSPGLYRATVSYTKTSGATHYVIVGPDRVSSTTISGSALSTWLAASTDTIYAGYIMSSYGTQLFDFLGNSSSTAPVLDEPTVFNTSGTRLGIVLEPAATNLLLQSQAFTTTWTTTNLETPTTGFTAPDGTSTAWKCVVSNGVTFGRIQQTVTLSGATAYRVSVFAKAGEWGWLGIRVPQDAADSCFFNLDSGVVGTTSGLWTNPTIEAFPNGWYRCSATYTTVGTSYTFRFAPTDADTVFTTGDGTSGIYLWGAQCEAGSTATSYIPTTTASVTRTADYCYRVLGPEFNSAAGTILIDAIPALPVSNVSNFVLAALSNNTSYGVGSGFLVRANSSTVITAGGNSSSAAAGASYTQNVKSISGGVFSVAGTIQRAGQGANAAASDLTLDYTGVGTTQITLGRLGSSASQFANQFIFSRLRLATTALSAADLLTATSGGQVNGTVTLDLNYETGVYQYTPVNAGVTTSYSLSTLISSGLMTLTGSPSAKWVRGSNGLLTEVAAGSLAIEYDASGNILGCINTEPARTNQCLRSDDLSAAGWTPVNATVTINQANGPTGAATLDLLKENAAAGVAHSIQLPSSTTTAQSYVLSCFARVGPGSRGIMLYGLNMDGRGIGFDLTNGTTFTVSGVSLPTLPYGIENWGGGLYRCWVGVTGVATTTNAGAIYLLNGTSFSYDGDNTSGAYVGAVQLEAGTYPSSYIPTTSASVTRNADVWTLNLGSWFDNSRWIVASKVYAPRANMNNGASATAIWTLDPPSGTSDWAIEYLSSTNRIDFDQRVGGVSGATGNNTGLTFPNVVRSGFGYSPSNAKASLNGSSQTLTGTPSAVQAPFTALSLGNWGIGTNPDQGSVYIQSLNILPVIPTQDNVNQYAGAA